MNRAFWLPLLRRLTDACPTWFALKNIDAALEGCGDVDSAVAPSELVSALELFAQHAQDRGLPLGLECRHLPGVVLAFAVDPPSDLVELDLMTRIGFRAGYLFRAEDLLQLTVLDPRGFRRLRAGAEAALLLLFNGLGSTGRRNTAQIQRKRVAEHLAADPAGVRLFASTTLPPGTSEILVALADRVTAGGWDRALACRLELGALGAALRHPGWAAVRWRVRRRGGKLCALTTAAISGRRITGDPEAWMRSASVGHEVLWTSVGGPGAAVRPS